MTIPARPYLDLSTQYLTVESEDWDAVSAVLSLHERNNFTSDWQKVAEFEAVTGKKGWAWGRGIHPENDDEPRKKEGDSKTPVGIFTLGKAFGYDTSKQKFPWPYIALTDKHKAIDDPESHHYNKIIEEDRITEKDWKSAEEMRRKDGLYKYGMVICHNTDKINKEAGSCIFMHLWRGPGQGTEGCTAMSEENMLKLLNWLKPGANPILFQGPKGVFDLPV